MPCPLELAPQRLALSLGRLARRLLPLQLVAQGEQALPHGPQRVVPCLKFATHLSDCSQRKFGGRLIGVRRSAGVAAGAQCEVRRTQRVGCEYAIGPAPAMRQAIPELARNDCAPPHVNRRCDRGHIVTRGGARQRVHTAEDRLDGAIAGRERRRARRRGAARADAEAPYRVGGARTLHTLHQPVRRLAWAERLLQLRQLLDVLRLGRCMRGAQLGQLIHQRRTHRVGRRQLLHQCQSLLMHGGRLLAKALLLTDARLECCVALTDRGVRSGQGGHYPASRVRNDGERICGC
mmetsp:Transcript_34930/g.112570  ORF Transcript_34930/g.112570 Transcript_34930/m.112570 type:complete len:292 (+) Transcript_34930:361-1236(+)|eukprot:scaffold249_cov132-Isochrysis_galbana.AAC.3